MMSGKNFLNSININGNCENEARINLSESRYKYGNKKLQKALQNRTGTKANKGGAAKRGKKVQKYTRDKRSLPQSPCFSTHTLAYCHTHAAAPVVSAFSPGC